MSKEEAVVGVIISELPPTPPPPRTVTIKMDEQTAIHLRDLLDYVGGPETSGRGNMEVLSQALTDAGIKSKWPNSKLTGSTYFN